MTAALTLSLLALGAAAQERLIVINVSTTDKTARQVAAQISEQILTEASRLGRFRVIGQSDISVMLGMERQKKLLGCSEDASSCTAELAGALDARWLLTGTLGRLGKKFRLDLKAIDTKTALVEQRAGVTLNAEEEVLEAIPGIVRSLLSALPEPKEVAQPLVTQPIVPLIAARPTPGPPVAPLVAGGAGLLAAGVGALLFGLGKGDEARWPSVVSTLSYKEGLLFAEGAGLKTNLGVVLMAVGGAAMASAVIWYFVTREPPPASLAFSVGPSGVIVGGRW